MRIAPSISSPGGFTITELMVSIALLGLVTTISAAMLLLVSEEQVRATRQRQLAHEAALLQSTLIDLLRDHTVFYGATFTDNSESRPHAFTRLILNCPGNVQNELTFDASTGNLKFTVGKTGEERAIFNSGPRLRLVDFHIYPGLKVGQAPDCSVIHCSWTLEEASDRNSRTRRDGQLSRHTGDLTIKLRRP